MCTHLRSEASWFLPPNKGWNDGAGNPPNPDGLKTDYLWKELLTRRGPAPGALFTNRTRGRFTYAGLREVLRRTAKAAGVPEPSLHSFRRAFALSMLRNGADLLSLQ